MTAARPLLVLGGTTEGRALAEALAGDPAWRVTTSLAGRVSRPRLAPGGHRSGGFGGADGLADWLTAHRVAAVVDATHPFAARITANAATACARAGVPLVVVQRPGWTAAAGDRWRRVPSLAAAAAALTGWGPPDRGPGAAAGPLRVFLATGRQSLPAFAECGDVHFVARMVDPPDGPLPRHCAVVLSRGPFTVEGERELLARYAVDVVVSKDSGGAATVAKLLAARERRLPVLLVDRPPLPAGVTAVSDVGAALGWLAARD